MENLLKPDIGLMFWTILNFLLLVLVLGKFAWKPLLKALEDREERLRSDRLAAERAKTDAEKIRDELSARMDSMAGEARAALREAVAAGEKEKESILAAARSQSDVILANARQELEEEKNRLVAELRRDVAGISLLAAERVIVKQMDQKTNKEIVDHLLKEMDSGKR